MGRFGIPQSFNENLGKDLKGQEINNEEDKNGGDNNDGKNNEDLNDKNKSDNLNNENNKAEQDKNKSSENLEINDDSVIAYLKAQGREVESLEDLFQSPKEVEKIVEKEVNPYADLFDAEDTAYFNYKKETGRGRKDFEFLNKDIGKTDALQLSIERLKAETGLSLSDEEAKEYLEETLTIDLNDEESKTKNSIALNKYAKPYRDQLISDQEKYRTPIEKAQKKNENKVDMVTLDNGKEMPKSEYDAYQKQRNTYLDSINKAVNSVAASTIEVNIDDNGDKRALNLSFEPSKEDKHSMLSSLQDVDAMIQNRYQSKDGFNYKDFSEDIAWTDKNYRNKVISSFVNQAVAEVIESLAKEDNNITFGRQRIDKTKKNDGYGSLTSGDNQQQGFGVKVPFKTKGQ